MTLKFSQLPSATAAQLQDADIIPGVNSSGNVKIALSELRNSVINPINPVVHPGYVSGRYYITNKYASNLGSASTGISSSTITYFPFEIEAPVTINELDVICPTATAGSLGRIGIYSSLNDTKGPGVLLTQAATELDYSTVGTKIASISNLDLTRGIYYIAMNCNVTPTLNTAGSGYYLTHLIGRPAVSASTLLQFRQTVGYGVLPNNAPTYDLLTLSAATPPAVWFKVA